MTKTYKGTVTRVIDGDTIEVDVNGEIERIRLIGLDAPEMEFEEKDQELQAKKATFTAVNELIHKEVEIEVGVAELDPYGRVQGWVWQDDKLFNELIIEKGEAYLDTYQPNVQYQDKLIEAQTKARQEKAGLWAVDFFDHAPEEEFGLNLTNTNLEIDIPNINQYSNDEYILARRDGIGASDLPIILGENPFQTPQQLYESKLIPYITEEERKVGDKPAVRKGRDLENLIIKRLKEYFKFSIWKPKHQFRHKEYPFLKINYDGVTGNYKQYIPVEVKVVTYFGEKNYNFCKAHFREGKDWFPLPEDLSNHKNVKVKAEHYGIPPYYYIQLQAQMLGLNASYGYLAALQDKDWLVNLFHIWRDEQIQNQIIMQGFKFWQNVLKAKNQTYEQWVTSRQSIPEYTENRETINL